MTEIQSEWVRQNIQKYFCSMFSKIKTHEIKEGRGFRTIGTGCAHDLDHELEELIRLGDQGDANHKTYTI